MSVRFNMQELIDDLVSEGFTKASAITLARKENTRRQNKEKSLANIKARNDKMIEWANTIPKMFT